jgi:glycosyltransferase involved in cell wall biosynthesis
VVKRVAFAVPGDLAIPTGGYAYDRRIVAELGAMLWRVQVVDLGDSFPRPDVAQRAAALARLAALPAGQPVVIDGLAYGVLPEAPAVLGQDRPAIALVHHPLALETGLPAVEAERLRHSERAALAGARRVITTSAATARLLAAEYGVVAERVVVAPPGADLAPLASGSSDGIVRLIAVGSLVPRKGYDVLIAALASLADLPWQLTIAGDPSRDPATAARLKASIVDLKLADRVTFVGAVSQERLAELYGAADLFVLASRFEGYGMAFADAVARGLPVIGTTAGAIPEAVPEGTGVLVPPDDVAALAQALRRLIEDRGERRRLAFGARRMAARFPSWQSSAVLFARTIEALA